MLMELYPLLWIENEHSLAAGGRNRTVFYRLAAPSCKKKDNT
jgi:hypothetical protein